MSDIEEWVKSRKKKGVSDEKLKKVLKEKGYDPGIVDNIDVNRVSEKDPDLESSDSMKDVRSNVQNVHERTSNSLDSSKTAFLDKLDSIPEYAIYAGVFILSVIVGFAIPYVISISGIF